MYYKGTSDLKIKCKNISQRNCHCNTRFTDSRQNGLRDIATSSAKKNGPSGVEGVWLCIDFNHDWENDIKAYERHEEVVGREKK